MTLLQNCLSNCYKIPKFLDTRKSAIITLNVEYHKVSKFSDTRNFCCNLPKIQTQRQNFRIFSQKDTNGIANSEDPDQTAPLCPDLFVRKLRIITVI